MHVIYITDKPKQALVSHLSREVKKITCVKTSAKLVGEIDAIIIDTNQDDWLDQVHLIKRQIDLSLVPLFADSKTDHDVFDGDFEVDAVSILMDRVHKIQQRRQQLPETIKDWHHAVLMFLFTRPDKSLNPIKDWRNKYFYHYPLLDVFNPSQEGSVLWVQNAINTGVLEKGELVDQLFACPECLSAHLHFAECCPHCKSIDIHTEAFIHCFTCGHMAPQQAFIQSDRLICPKCHTQLRHIGNDYDRPLESGVCNSCHESYIDSDVLIKCMVCQQPCKTETLHKEMLYCLMLSDVGRHQIEFNQMQSALTVFDQINYVHPDYFYAMLDWLLDMQKRYQDETFSLIGIHFSLKSPDSVAAHILKVAEQLRTLLRTADILTRNHEHYVWILLPKTSLEGLEVVKERITTCLTSFDTLKDHVHLTHFTSQHKQDDVGNAKLLLAQLASTL